MAYQNKKIEKYFFSIGEVADMFGVNPSLIRFWEKEFSNIKPQKNNKGNRMYTKEAIEEIRIVYHLVKDRGMTLKGAQQKIKENREDVIQEQEILKRLYSIREVLEEIKNEL